jgi:ornithine carbamoyltransferase
MKKDLISISDLEKDEVLKIFSLAKDLKNKKFKSKNFLKNKTAVLIFEKPSLRTRVTFEVGIKQLGGETIYLSQQDILPAKRETISDIAKNLSLWVDLIIYRSYSHSSVLEIGKYSNVPVINALSDREHPCQALSDFFTILEYKKNLKNLKFSYIGDGNNVCNSLLLVASKLGISLTIATPKGYEPDEEILNIAKEESKVSGSRIELIDNPYEAAKGAEIIYTDVWVSMGQEKEERERKKIFRRFQINKDLLKFASNNCLIMHCLPAHRGEEITDEVLDGKNSIVLKQAENRLHIQKAIIIYLCKHNLNV